MNTLKKIGVAAASMLNTSAWAHPGHSVVSIEHTHSIFPIDPLATLLLVAIAVVASTLWWKSWRTRRVLPRH